MAEARVQSMREGADEPDVVDVMHLPVAEGSVVNVERIPRLPMSEVSAVKRSVAELVCSSPVRRPNSYQPVRIVNYAGS